MGKSGIKKWLSEMKEGIIDPSIRRKFFLLLASFLIAVISLTCFIINITTKEFIIANISFIQLVSIVIMLVVELCVFIKRPNIKNTYFELVTFLISFITTATYMFFIPPILTYALWICIHPILYCLAFGFKRGLVYSLISFVFLLMVFYLPFISQHTNFENLDEHWSIKGLVSVYYFVCLLIGGLIGLINYLTIKRLNELKDVYYEDANTDITTGLRNQAYYLSYVNNLHKIVKAGDTIGLMFIDIDDFKKFNDKFGHSVGNEVLVGVANKLNEVPHALCARWGGDEFAIVERNLTRDEFIAKANYLLKSVAALPQGVTISIGLAFYVIKDNFDFQKIFNEADMQAISAKEKGKNCVVIKE